MALSDSDRHTILARLAAEAVKRGEEWGVNKPELLAAIDAVDDWIMANRQGFNDALPPAAQALNARQKGRLLAAVTLRLIE